MIRLLLADDNAATRSALGLLLATRLATHDIVTAVDWDRLLALAGEAAPTIALFDWELPGRPVHEGLAALRCVAPEATLIAMSARPEARQDALLAGVDAFIAKSEPPERVLDTLRLFLQADW